MSLNNTTDMCYSRVFDTELVAKLSGLSLTVSLSILVWYCRSSVLSKYKHEHIPNESLNIKNN